MTTGHRATAATTSGTCTGEETRTCAALAMTAGDSVVACIAMPMMAVLSARTTTSTSGTSVTNGLFELTLNSLLFFKFRIMPVILSDLLHKSHSARVCSNATFVTLSLGALTLILPLVYIVLTHSKFNHIIINPIDFFVTTQTYFE